MSKSMNQEAIRELHLFAGIGGGILGGLLLGHVPVCAVELEEYPRNVLLQRQRDGILPWFPVWDDARTFDGTPWRGRVDLVSGGFPCQDISTSHRGGLGLDGPKSGLWIEFRRIVGEVRPAFVFVENVSNLRNRGIERIFGDLAALGYVGCHGVLGGSAAGLDTEGERMWIVAASTGVGRESLLGCLPEIDRWACGREAAVDAGPSTLAGRIAKHEERCGEPSILGEPFRLAHRVDRLRSVGNVQFPSLAALAFRTLFSRLIG